MEAQTHHVDAARKQINNIIIYKNMLNKKRLIFAIIFFLFFPMAFYVTNNIDYKFSIVKADDDEASEASEKSEGSYEDEEDNYDYENSVVDDVEEFISNPIITPAPETIYEEETVEVITISDRDNDGIADENDPHPDVAEIYVVIDEDANGIVDEFETYFEEIKANE